tara:strand:+ start:2505 stop:5300 length:2796 start_codon:yes stop_codon:yes gene_type:complete
MFQFLFTCPTDILNTNLVKTSDRKVPGYRVQMNDIPTNSSPFPPWLTQTKTLPLRHHISLIDRPELCRRLNAGFDQKLTLLSAPAGFGKTTLLRQWRTHLQAKDIAVAWLKIDEDDNDPSILALYLAFALSSAGLSQEIIKIHPGPFTLNATSRTIVGTILSAIANYGKKVVLILDNVECVSQNTAKKILIPLFTYSPHNFHIVLATRTVENMPLSALKLQGQVSQITAADLKFTPFEIEVFLNQTLTKKKLQKISAKTEGWPVALQFIKNALSGHSESDKIIDRFHGTEQDARNYILEQILNTLPAAQRDLLLEASILDTLDPVSLDRLRGTTDTSQTLQGLETLKQLITPVNNQEEHYRLNPLFQEALVYFLEQSNPDRMKLLHLRAAEMFMEEGHIIHSIRHALKAKEPETAAHFLEQAGGIHLWNKEGMTRIRKAHALLPEEIIQTRPRLNLLRALIFLKDGHLNDARHIFETVQRDVESQSHSPSAELEYDLAIITCTLAVYEGAPLNKEMSTRLVASIEKFKDDDKTQTGFVYTILCVFNLQKGNFPTARHVGKKAISHFQKYNSVFGEAYIYLHLGVVATAEGNLEKAGAYYKKVQDCQRRYFIDDKDMRLVLNIAMAEWHYERNELSTAARLLGDINRRLETGEAWYEIYASGYSTSTALAYLQKGLSTCLNLSEDSSVYIKREGLKRLNRLVMANKVGYLCRAGKIVQARRIVQENNLSVQDYCRNSTANFSVRESYGTIQALTRLLIAEMRYEEAIRELRLQIDIHQGGYEIRALQKYRLLLAIALFGNDDEKEALHELESVLHFVRTQGFLRFILDEAPFVTPLLSAFITETGSAEKDHAQYLLGLLEDAQLPKNDIILSRREKQVLDQLAEGYSDKVIARNLDVSENTVRFHLKNLFRKLTVNSRLMAVSEATKHKLLK